MPTRLSRDEKYENGIEFEAWYRDGTDDIVQPDQIVKPQTRYFWKHWVRVLGVGPTALLIRLRMACYYNPETGERRDSCFLGQDTLAQELGVGDRKTIRRWLRRLEQYDFIRRSSRMRWSNQHARPVRTTDKYLVKTWDPALPDHQSAAQNAATVKQEGHGAAEIPSDFEKGQNAPLGESPAVDGLHKGQNAPHDAGEKRASMKKDLEEGKERYVVSRIRRLDSPRGNAELTPIGHLLRDTHEKRGPRPEKRLADILPEITTSPAKRDELLRVEALSHEMLDQLGDSRSRPFYRVVARRFLTAGMEQLVHQALSEIKEGERSGSLRNPGAVFTARIKELAIAHGIELRAAA